TAGWPLTLLLTPEGKPFFAGTYFPKRTMRGLTGLIDLLTEAKDTWKDRKKDIIKESNYILKEVDSRYNSYSKGNIDKDILIIAKKELENIYDKANGGFSYRPKFPLPQYILFLLEYGYNLKDEKSLNMAKKTLDNMYKGGIFDHVGFGFYRYSVDEKWLVPHFEKMLYDNALLAIAYIRAYEITGELLYKDIGEKIFEFVLRDMTSDIGGFYSALDAETEGEEGKYYVFEYDEIINLLGEEFGRFYASYYDISEEGNFEGKNIPNLIGKNLNSITEFDMNKLNSMRVRILSYRDKRIKPHRDEKILTSWNGLMIAALAYGGKVLNKNLFIKKAKESADFIISNSIDKKGYLLSTHIDGKSYNYGYLEDYAFFIYGLLTLYKVTEEEVYLEISKKLKDDMVKLFWDEKDGGFYYYSHISESLILRPKDFYDGAIPSGNSFAALSLQKLYRIIEDEEIYERLNQIFYSFGDSTNKNPTAYIYSILASRIFDL
ncbi:thioredoxin domain-containing protein, partial [Schnuerera sp.]|uniref:thioredoxin domain-containing protein n=1 Tax=Schnuerera sp. TaxID=2794844 RepID=UPI002C53BC28